MSSILDDAQRDGVVVGLGKAIGSVVNRVDVDTLLTQGPMTFNLFVIALAELQADQLDDQNKMHYFQIAGTSLFIKNYVVKWCIHA